MAQFQTKVGVQISFDSKKATAINDNLHALILSIQSGYFLPGFHVSPSILMLSSIVSISGITDEELVSSMIFAAGVDIQNEKKVGPNTFFEALGLRVRQHLSIPAREFHLLFPLNYRRNLIPAEQISINRLDFEIKSWNEIDENYDISALKSGVNDFIQFTHNTVYWHEQSTPLLLKIHGRSAEEVFRRGEKAFEVLISAINYLLDKSITIQLSRNSPMGKVILPVGYGVFETTGKLDSPYVDIDYLNLQTLCNEKLEFDKLQSVFNLSQSNNKIDQRFLQAILAHNDGLKTTNWDNAFLSFWRVFEILTFGDRTDYDMNSVVQRLSLLIKPDNITKGFLNLCAYRRNSLVHRGIFTSEEQPYVLMSKLFSKLCLTKFERLLQNFRNEQMIEKYFEMAGLSNDQLKVQLEVIETIIKERNI